MPDVVRLPARVRRERIRAIFRDREFVPAGEFAEHSLVGPLAGLVLAQIHAGICFLGCNGVDVDAGVANVKLPEAQIKQLMLRSAQRRVVCADHRKVGAVALAQLCDLDDVDLLITDRGADREPLAGLRDTGLEVQLA